MLSVTTILPQTAALRLARFSEGCNRLSAIQQDIFIVTSLFSINGQPYVSDTTLAAIPLTQPVQYNFRFLRRPQAGAEPEDESDRTNVQGCLIYINRTRCVDL